MQGSLEHNVGKSGIVLWRALLAIAAVTACVMALLPETPRLPGEPSDALLHALAFGVLVLLSRMAFPASAAGSIVVCLATLGLAIEAVQLIPALGRDASLVDWAIDIAASTFVLLGLSLLGLGQTGRGLDAREA